MCLRTALLSILSLTLVFSTPALADNLRVPNDATLDFYAANGIYYYNPYGIDTGCRTNTNGSDVVIIGDSITNGASNAIKSKLPDATIYAKDGKIFGKASNDAMDPDDNSGSYGTPSGISILKWLNDNNKMATNVVFALGTNKGSGIDSADVDAVVDLVGNTRRLYLVTNYKLNNPSAYDDNNALFAQANQLANVTLIDWASAVADDPTKYINSSDGYDVHPTNPDGNELFAQLISDAVGGAGSVTGGASGNYTDYSGVQALSEAAIQRLESLVPWYEEAISKSQYGKSDGITWQILAAIHYKERFFEINNPSNGQGIWQLYTYVQSHPDAFPPTASDVSKDEFISQTVIAIDEVMHAKANGLNLSNDDNLKKFFFRYNGVSNTYIQKALDMGFTQEQAENGEGSPYVMNYYDAERDPRNPATMSPYWPGMHVQDGRPANPTATSSTYGAYTLWSILGGATMCTGASSGGLGMSDAAALMKDYLSSNVRCEDYTDNCSGKYGRYGSDGKANCVTFVQYFVARFTTIGKLGLNNGKYVVSELVGQTVHGVSNLGVNYSSRGFSYGGGIPKVYSIFSLDDGNMGHTGVVLGIDKENDKIYIGQASYSKGLQGTAIHDQWVLSSIEYSYSNFVSENDNGKHWYAYIDEDKIKYDEIDRAIAAGKSL